MHLIGLLIQKNQLSGRRYITPLGFVVVGIVLLFVGALIFGWFRIITRNVNPLDSTQPLILAQSAEVAAPAEQGEPQRAPAAPGWSVKVVQTPLGENAVEAPPEVTEAVLRDYDAAIKDWDAHKFDLAYLHQHAPDFFIGKQLERMQSLLKWMEQENQTVALGGYELLSIGRSVQYAPSGVQAFVVEYIAAGTTFEYNLKTKAKMNPTGLPDRIVMTEVSYDVAVKRWKISRIALSMDLKTKQVLWQDR